MITGRRSCRQTNDKYLCAMNWLLKKSNHKNTAMSTHYFFSFSGHSDKRSWKVDENFARDNRLSLMLVAEADCFVLSSHSWLERAWLTPIYVSLAAYD